METLQRPVGGIPAPPATSTRSFKAVLGSSSSPASFFSAINPDPIHHSHAGRHKGSPSITFQKDHVLHLFKTFQWTLIGKFPQGYNKENPKLGRPPVDSLQKYFEAFDFQGAFQIGLLDNRHLLIHFKLQEDFLRIYSKPVWYIGGQPMRIFKWSSNFHVARESSIVPIWVSLPHLPVRFFEQNARFAICSLIGCPLRLDSATRSLKRPSTARVQIEVDLLKEQPSKIWIETEGEEGFWQKLDYENLPGYCQTCWHVGHSNTQCSFNNPGPKTRDAHSSAHGAELRQVQQVYVPKQKVSEATAMVPASASLSQQLSTTDPTPELTISPTAIVSEAVVVSLPLTSAGHESGLAKAPLVFSEASCSREAVATGLSDILMVSMGDDISRMLPKPQESSKLLSIIHAGDAILQPLLLVAQEIGFIQQPIEESPAPAAKPLLVVESDDVSRATLLETAIDNALVVVATGDHAAVSTDEHSKPAEIDSANDIGKVVNVNPSPSTQLVCGTESQAQPLAILNPYAAAFHFQHHPMPSQSPTFQPLLPQTSDATSMGYNEGYTDTVYYPDTYGSDELEEDDDQWSPGYEDMTDGSEGSLLMKRKAKKKNRVKATNHPATPEDFKEESRRIGLRLNKRGRPPGSRNRTYFGMIRTMETRSSKSTSY